jgi:hypothetical protein
MYSQYTSSARRWCRHFGISGGWSTLNMTREEKSSGEWRVASGEKKGKQIPADRSRDSMVRARSGEEI